LALFEDLKRLVIVAATEDKVYAIDEFTGQVYASVDIDQAYLFAYSSKNSRMYSYDGTNVSRYTVFADRTGSTSVNYDLGHAADMPVSDVVRMAVQDHEDALVVATKTELLRFNTGFDVVSRDGTWNSISSVNVLNYASSVMRRDGFESPYTLKYVPSTDSFVYCSPSTGGVTVVSSDGTSWTSLLDGFVTLGVDADVGGVAVSCEDTSGRKYVVEFGYDQTLLSRKGTALSGNVMIVDSDSVADDGIYGLSAPQFEEITGQFSGLFTATDGTPGTIAPYFHEAPDKVDPEFFFLGDGKSTFEKVLDVDSYLFDRSGLDGTKVSVNDTLPGDFRTGEARRTPVFSWEFHGDRGADVFAVGILNEVVRMARGDKGYVIFDTIASPGRVSSTAVFGDRLAFTSGSFVYFHNLFDGTLVSVCRVCDDVMVSSFDRDNLWAVSPSRGLVYRMPMSDIRRYERIQISDAPVAVFDGPDGRKVVMCENSILTMSSGGSSISTAVNMEGYRVSGSDSYGDLLAACFTSYDDIPTKEMDGSSYDTLVKSRRRDNIRVTNLNTGAVVYSVELGASSSAVACRFLSQNSLFVVRRDVGGIIDKTIVVEYVDLATGDSVVSSIETNITPVSACVLDSNEAIVVSLKDGSMVFADTAGNISLEQPYEQKQSSSSSSSSSSSMSSSSSGESSSLIPESYVEPERLTACSRASVTHPISIILNHADTQAGGEYESEWYDRVQVKVGRTYGGSELWDSGTVLTPKTSILYGGGNNLQPGQRYYVSVSVGTEKWQTPYTTSEFILGHFPGYVDSSSSSSSAVCSILGAGEVVELPKPPLPGSGLGYDYCVQVSYSWPETAEVIVGGYRFVVGESGGYPVWDCGTSRQHVFSYSGETIVRSVDGSFFSVTYHAGSIILALNAADSSSSSSSSSARPFPDVFDGGITGLPLEQTIWRIDARHTYLTVDDKFDAGETS
jgi:hypothetical protein